MESRKGLKRIVSLILSVAFIFISLPDISHAEEYEGGEAAKIMAEIIEINNILSKYGLTLEDFRDFAIREESFYEEIRRIVMDSPTAPEITFLDENGASEGESRTLIAPTSSTTYKGVLEKN